MKPMKLETFNITDEPLDTFGSEAFENLQSPVNKEIAGMIVLGKRLTEAQLAAEFESARCDAMLLSEAGRYYAALGDTWPKDKVSVHRRAMTLLRFATLPHYDEVPE